MPVPSLENTPLLNFIAEKKLSKLLGEFAPSRLEASGVCIQDSMAMVVFDNLSQMARINASLEPGEPENALIGLPANEAGYEGLTWDQSERKFYVVMEAVKRRKRIRGQIHVLDERLVLLESHWLGYPLKAKNKGFEGIVHMRRNGEEYLLGLMGWSPLPEPASECHSGMCNVPQIRRGDHDEDYDDWDGFGKECYPGAWG